MWVRNGLLWLLLAGYYLAVVLLHEVVQGWLRLLVQRWSFVGYEWRVVALWSGLCLPLFVWAGLRLWRAGARRDLALFGIWLTLTAVLDGWVLVTESERIHYPQYALVSLALRHLLGRPWAALGVSVVLGGVDEAYQALVLYGDRPDLSLDFKDMALNAVGAVGGLILYQVVRRTPRSGHLVRT